MLVNALREADDRTKLQKVGQLVDLNLDQRLRMSQRNLDQGLQYGKRKRTLPNLISPEMYDRIHCSDVKNDLNSVISEF